MSNVTLLLILTGLVVVSGIFLTFSWSKYLAYRHDKKKDKKAASD